ncbi:amidase [gamma proteobacterium HdN1]|nr:amidase [gamma proteobacterium HdN1]
MATDWEYQTAKQQLQAIQKGEVSSRDLLEHCIARVERLNPALNAVVATDYVAARQRADEADAARNRGESLGPLHGLPMTIKDTWEVPGMPCTAGAGIFRDYRPKKPAVAVNALESAGAIVFGKTNVPVFASDLQSFNKIYGTTRNPWDVKRTPGGSSGGAAAALAAGFTALELGSDIGGSIRIPAHFCGVYGHKPTHGIVSLRGHIPGPPGTMGEGDLVVGGPLARSAEDLQLAMDVIAGDVPLVQPGWNLKLPAAKQKKLQDFRVLLWVDDAACPLDTNLVAQYGKLERALRESGVSVDKSNPLGMDLDQLYPTYLNLLGSVMGVSRKKFERRLMGLAAPLLHRLGQHLDAPRHFDQFLAGAGQSHADWLRFDERRNRLREKFKRVFEQYDVILMPPALTTAIPHNQERELPLRKIEINGARRNYADLLMWISPATLMGLPATSAPVGITDSGLPCNIQIVGAPYQDKTTIKFASLLAKVIGGFTPPSL